MVYNDICIIIIRSSQTLQIVPVYVMFSGTGETSPVISPSLRKYLVYRDSVASHFQRFSFSFGCREEMKETRMHLKTLSRLFRQWYMKR